MYGALILMTVVGCVYLALFVFTLVRFHVAMSARDKAVDIISAGDLDQSIAGKLDQMVWSLRKWTFRQFYPELADRGES